jgi:hypothetical protein
MNAKVNGTFSQRTATQEIPRPACRRAAGHSGRSHDVVSRISTAREEGPRFG